MIYKKQQRARLCPSTMQLYEPLEDKDSSPATAWPETRCSYILMIWSKHRGCLLLLQHFCILVTQSPILQNSTGKNYLQSQICSLVTELHFIFKFLFPCHQSKMTIINKFNKNKMPLFSSSPKEGIKVILLLKLLSKEKGGRNSHFFLISYSNVKKNISSSLYEANISTASLIYSHFSRLRYKESIEGSQERKKKSETTNKTYCFLLKDKQKAVH